MISSNVTSVFWLNTTNQVVRRKSIGRRKTCHARRRRRLRSKCSSSRRQKNCSGSDVEFYGYADDWRQLLQLSFRYVFCRWAASVKLRRHPIIIDEYGDARSHVVVAVRLPTLFLSPILRRRTSGGRTISRSAACRSRKAPLSWSRAAAAAAAAVAAAAVAVLQNYRTSKRRSAHPARCRVLSANYGQLLLCCCCQKCSRRGWKLSAVGGDLETPIKRDFERCLLAGSVSWNRRQIRFSLMLSCLSRNHEERYGCCCWTTSLTNRIFRQWNII